MKAAGNQDIVILSARRTPFGTYGGSLKDLSATDLGVHAARAALAQSGVAPADVGHVVFGNVAQTSADAIYLARHVGLKAGVPERVRRDPGSGGSGTMGFGLPSAIGAWFAHKDEEIWAQVVDYSESYPQCIPGSLGEENNKQLKNGRITVQGKEVPTAGLSSYRKAKEIAGILKEWIQTGKFLLTQAVELLPSAESGIAMKPLNLKAATMVVTPLG